MLLVKYATSSFGLSFQFLILSSYLIYYFHIYHQSERKTAIIEFAYEAPRIKAVLFSVGHPPFLRIEASGFFALIATCIAFSVMHRNHIAAACATILFSLTFKEFSHASFLNHSQVFNHAHTVPCSVMLVKLDQFVAGHVFTFITEADMILPQFFAISFDKRTILVSH